MKCQITVPVLKKLAIAGAKCNQGRKRNCRNIIGN
jgi:hypothetical protein